MIIIGIIGIGLPIIAIPIIIIIPIIVVTRSVLVYPYYYYGVLADSLYFPYIPFEGTPYGANYREMSHL